MRRKKGKRKRRRKGGIWENNAHVSKGMMGTVFRLYSRRQNKVPITDSKNHFKVVTKPLSKFFKRATSRIKVAYNSA